MRGQYGHPLGSRRHIDYSTNNHPPQLRASDDLDFCFMAFLSWGMPVGPRIMSNMTIREESFKNYRSRTSEKWMAKEDKSRRPRSRRSREAMVNGNMPTGNHHLGQGNNQ